MIWFAYLLLWAPNALPEQIQRGEALFVEPAKGCVNCHALKGHGTAVGPDLREIGKVSPQAIATGMRATLTEFVQNVRLKSGEAFPGMPAGSDETSLKFYDVSKMPPELRQVARADVQKTGNETVWKHPPAAGNYTNEQIADIVAYVRYAVTGTTRPISTDEVQ
jgi:mono/diheme cytochrome c family protein